MFVESILQRRVPVEPREGLSSVGRVLLMAFSGRYIPGHGLEILASPIRVEDAIVEEGILYPLVTYRALVFRVYPWEVLECRVERQDESGVFLSNQLILHIFVSKARLPQPSSSALLPMRGKGHALVWFWSYSQSKLYVQNGDVCRVRAISSECTGTQITVEASMIDQGLGPRSWWE
jgi:DNA-directed RNA polymerase subunit E'/Rpb7